MKKSGILLSMISIIVLWQGAAMAIHNDFLIPYPMDVLSMMILQSSHLSFYNILFHTLFRSLYGLVLAFLSAGICALLAYFFTFIKYLLSPIILLTKSIPNIAYIIIILVWFGSETSAIIIPFLILFPMIYTNLYEGLSFMDQDLKDVIRLYPQTPWLMLKKVYIPMLFPAINASLSNGLGLSFKVGVMAEILSQVSIGIGKQLNIARFNMDMTAIFAWTVWIIIVLMGLEFLRKVFMKEIQK